MSVAYSTNQVAKKLGMNQANLQRLIRQKLVPFPPLRKIGGMTVRLWTTRDVERLKKSIAMRHKKRGKK